MQTELLEAIYKKIPELKGTKTITLTKLYFERLNDVEFTILYTMPGLLIQVAPKTMEYIENRRVELGIDKAKEIK